jgi:hypothetical protein
MNFQLDTSLPYHLWDHHKSQHLPPTPAGPIHPLSVSGGATPAFTIGRISPPPPRRSDSLFRFCRFFRSYPAFVRQQSRGFRRNAPTREDFVPRGDHSLIVHIGLRL